MSIARLGVDIKASGQKISPEKSMRYLLNLFVFGTKLVWFVNHASKSNTWISTTVIYEWWELQLPIEVSRTTSKQRETIFEELIFET